MKKPAIKIQRNLAPVLAGCLAVSVSHTAYSLELPDLPLLLVSSIEPNVMVVLDDSGSMADDWYYGDYDPNANYGSCPSSIRINGYYANGQQWRLVTAKTDSNGNAYFEYQGNNYAWGTQNAYDTATGYPQRCFDPNDFYYVKYSDDFTNHHGNNWSINNYRALYGNFWNFYFSNDDQTDGDNWGEEDQKFGVGERIEIAQDAAKILVRNIDGIRVGLGGFDGSEGGRVLVNVDSVDAVVNAASGQTQTERMIEQINNIQASGYTPLGETLYEMGRYFVEGKQNQELTLHPEATATTQSTGTQQTRTASSVFAGEPKYEGAASKPTEPVIEAYCQKSYVVMLTDGLPTQDSNVSNDVKNYAANHNATTTNGIFDDVALALYDMDLRPDLKEFDGTPVRNNITTYLIAGFGLQATTELNNTVDNGAGVGVDINEDGSNATSSTLYQADDGDQLVNSFDRIFEEIFSKAGSQTSVAFNAGAIEAGTALYQATYNRVEYRWTGDLKSYPYDENTFSFAATPSWSAATKLDQKVLSGGHGSRLILTYSKNNDGMEFTEANWNNLSAEQQDDLKGGNNDAHGKAVLRYLRGESNTLFRDRATYQADGTTVDKLGLLGDIVNSSPERVGEPELNYPDYGAKADDGSTITAFGSSTNKYSSFAQAKKNRQGVVYVGSNDGMLHAFSGDPTSGGDELFAYIPGLVFDDSDNEQGLYYLTDERYQHRFYVDGAITASDVYIDPAGGTVRSWRTVLAGGLRAGGKGIYALDVTDPTTFSAANAEDMVLWEFGADDDSDVGHIYGDIQISMMNNGKWAAIFGNGYNSASGEAKLFIVYIEPGADGTWSTGDWVELGTGVSGDNGMATPVLADFNGDRIVDRIYAGDLKGNLWVYDVSNGSDTNWATAYGNSTSPSPLFVARDSDGNAQPITTRPSVTLNPETSDAGNGYNALVYVGTGKMLEVDDYANADEMTFYAVWDRGDGNLDRSDLTVRTLAAATITLDDGSTMATRTVSGSDISWYNGTDGSYGWVMDMPQSGERITINPRVRYGQVLFTTSLPTTTACANGGAGWVISLGWNGLSSSIPMTDIDGDGDVDEDDLGYVAVPIQGIAAGMESAENKSNSAGCGQSQTQRTTVVSDSSGGYKMIEECVPAGKVLGRMSWQDLLRR